MRLPTTLALVATGLVLTAGCADVEPPAAVEIEDREQPPTQTGNQEFPPLPDGVITAFERASPAAAGYVSRYVLLEGGRFVLQRLPRYHEYDGFYVRSGLSLTFRFAVRSRAGPWQATGTLAEGEDRLEVQYDPVMWLNGFEDGTFTRVD